MKAHVKIALLLSAVFVASANAQQNATSAPRNIVRFAGILENVQSMAEFRGPILPIARNARFAISVRITSVEPKVPELSIGSVVAIAIHSPSQLFGGTPQVGKIYAFTVERNEMKLSNLELTSVREAH